MSLHRRLNQMVESLEADLDGQVDNDLLVQDLMSFAGDAASLESHIAALTVELKQVSKSHMAVNAAWDAARAQLATERAAREAAEKQRDDAVVLAMGRASAESFYAEVNARKQAERERDTALARVRELEAAHAELTDMCKHGIDAHKAAETALASAREHARIALAYLDDKEDVESTPLHAIGHARTELRALLSSAPSPAPVADGKAFNEGYDAGEKMARSALAPVAAPCAEGKK